MRVRLFILAGLVLSATTIVEAYQAQSLSFSRPSVESVILGSPPKSPVKVYEDADFAFLYSRSGQAGQTPGFFVYGKKLNRWMEIKKLSTENATLGRLASGEEVSPSVGKKPYAEMPLKAGGSISFPDRIKYDAETDVYMLEFDPWQKKKEHVTRFWVDKEDLEEAFTKAR